MKAVLWGANGAMGKLIDGILGDEVVGRVSTDGCNGVARSAQELGPVDADVVIPPQRRRGCDRFCESAPLRCRDRYHRPHG